MATTAVAARLVERLVELKVVQLAVIRAVAARVVMTTAVVRRMVLTVEVRAARKAEKLMMSEITWGRGMRLVGCPVPNQT